jgi:hypothetical protein
VVKTDRILQACFKPLPVCDKTMTTAESYGFFRQIALVTDRNKMNRLMIIRLLLSHPENAMFFFFRRQLRFRKTSGNGPLRPCLCFQPLPLLSLLVLSSSSFLPAAIIQLETLSRIQDSQGNDLTNGLVLVGSFFDRPDTGNNSIASLFSANLATTRTNFNSTNFFSSFADGAVLGGGVNFVGRDYSNPLAPVSTTNPAVQLIKSYSNATNFPSASLFLLIFNQSTVESSTEMMVIRPAIDSGSGLRPGFPEGDDSNFFFGLEAPTISELYPELFFGTWLDDGVTDGDGLRGFLKTAPMDQAFGISSALTATATNGSPFTYQIRANNGPISFEATGLPRGLICSASNGVISGVPNDNAANYPVILKSFGGTVTVSNTLVLSLAAAAGSPPVILTSTSPVTLFAGVNYSNAYTISASNAATNPAIVSYGASDLPTGLVVDTNTGVISGRPTQLVTNRTVTLSANNGAVGSGQISLTVTPPLLTYPALTFTAGTASNSLAPSVTSGYQPTTYVSPNLPAGLGVGNDGVISGTPTIAGLVTTSSITATDANGVASSSNVIITVNTLRPTINSTNTYTVFRGSNSTPYTLTTILTSTVVAPGSFAVTSGSLPSGLSLNGTSGVISGTPTDPKGLTTIGLQADNQGVPGGGRGPAFTLTIRVDVNPPIFDRSLKKNVAAGFAFHANNDALVATNDPEDFSLSGAPSWLRLVTIREGNRVFGRLSGTPPSAGIWSNILVTIANTNLAGIRQTNTTNLTITAVSSAPGAGSLGVRPGTFILNQNLAITYAPQGGFFLAGADLGADAPTSINVLGLPPGVGFASLDDRRRGLITGTPTQAGTFPCTVYVRNAKGFTRSTMTFRVISP